MSTMLRRKQNFPSLIVCCHDRNPRLNEAEEARKPVSAGHRPRASGFLYYLEGGFQLSGCSGEQKLNNQAERNHVSQGGAAGHVFACLEEQRSERSGSSHFTLFTADGGDLGGELSQQYQHKVPAQ